MQWWRGEGVRGRTVVRVQNETSTDQCNDVEKLPSVKL